MIELFTLSWVTTTRWELAVTSTQTVTGAEGVMFMTLVWLKRVISEDMEDIMRKWIVLWLASLVVVAGFTSAFVRAQAPSQVPPPFNSQAPANLRVASGADIGFRVDNITDGRVIGTLVVRINGQWVDTATSVAQRRLAER